MTNKAYIVANEQQEMAVLRIMEQQGYTWNDGDIPTHCMPSHFAQLTFPYVLTNRNFIGWLSIDDARLVNFKVLYDGQKEEQMSDKYVVSQEFMNKLEEWKASLKTNGRYYIYEDDIYDLPSAIENWWKNSRGHDKEANNRLITIIRWVNGEDVFEVEKPKKWVVRYKEPQGSVDGQPLYIWFVDELTLETETEATMPPYIRRFNTKEEAQSWANAHQEVVEVVDV